MSIQILLILYVIFVLGFTFFLAKKQNNEDFLISGRKRSSWQILLSKYASAIGISWFITYTAYAYEFGYGVFGLFIGFAIGYYLFAYWAGPKIYENSEKFKFYSMGDFVQNRLNNNAKRIVNYIVFLTQILWVVVSLVGGVKIIS